MTGLADRFFYMHGRILSDDGRVSTFVAPKLMFRTQDRTGPFQTRPTKKQTGFTEYGEFETSIWSESDLQEFVTDLHQQGSGLDEFLCMWGRDTDAAGEFVECANFLKLTCLPTTEIADEGAYVLTATPDENGVEIGRSLKAMAAITANGNTQASSVNNGTQGSAITIATSSIADPSEITTTTAHGFQTGDTVLIAGHTSVTPDINGSHVVTVTGTLTFTIPVEVTADGVDGTATRTSTRNGGAAHVQIDAAEYDGGTGITFTVQDSPDNVSFATLGTFAAVTTEVDATDESEGLAYRIEFTGSIDRYTAIAYAFGGSPGAAKSVTFAAAIIRNE